MSSRNTAALVTILLDPHPKDFNESCVAVVTPGFNTCRGISEALACNLERSGFGPRARVINSPIPLPARCYCHLHKT